MRVESSGSASSSKRRGIFQGSRASGGLLAIAATTVALWVIVVAGLALAGNYATGVPPWNAPDEPAHFNYVKHVATTGQLPELKKGDWDAPLLERLKSSKFPRSEPVDTIRYENWQPPLFYIAAAPIFNATSRFPQLEQIVVLRLLSVALSAVTVVLAFLAVRSTFPGEVSLQLAVSGFIAFLPMRSAIAGASTTMRWPRWWPRCCCWSWSG